MHAGFAYLVELEHFTIRIHNFGELLVTIEALASLFILGNLRWLHAERLRIKKKHGNIRQFPSILIIHFCSISMDFTSAEEFSSAEGWAQAPGPVAEFAAAALGDPLADGLSTLIKVHKLINPVLLLTDAERAALKKQQQQQSAAAAAAAAAAASAPASADPDDPFASVEDVVTGCVLPRLPHMRDQLYAFACMRGMEKAVVRINHNSGLTAMLELMVDDYDAGTDAIDQFKARCMKKTIAFFKRLRFPIERWEHFEILRGSMPEPLQKRFGIHGEETRAKLRQYFTTGTINKLDARLANEFHQAVKAFTTVWGIGAKKANMLASHPNRLRTIEELKRAVFGGGGQPPKPPKNPNTQKDIVDEDIRECLRHYDDMKQCIPRSEVDEIIATVRAAAYKVYGGRNRVVLVPCGSYRRGAATSGDVDILIAPPTCTGEALPLPPLLRELEKTGFLIYTLRGGQGWGSDARTKTKVRMASWSEALMAANGPAAVEGASNPSSGGGSGAGVGSPVRQREGSVLGAPGTAASAGYALQHSPGPLAHSSAGSAGSGSSRGGRGRGWRGYRGGGGGGSASGRGRGGSRSRGGSTAKRLHSDSEDSGGSRHSISSDEEKAAAKQRFNWTNVWEREKEKRKAVIAARTSQAETMRLSQSAAADASSSSSSLAATGAMPSEEELTKPMALNHLRFWRKRFDYDHATYMGLCRLPPHRPDGASASSSSSSSSAAAAASSSSSSSGGVQRRLVRRIDIKSYAREDLATAVLYFTGSDYFNRSMRAFVKQHSWTLSDRGLRAAKFREDNGERDFEGPALVTNTERDVFRALGIPYRAPHERNCELKEAVASAAEGGAGGAGAGGAADDADEAVDDDLLALAEQEDEYF